MMVFGPVASDRLKPVELGAMTLSRERSNNISDFYKLQEYGAFAKVTTEDIHGLRSYGSRR